MSRWVLTNFIRKFYIKCRVVKVQFISLILGRARIRYKITGRQNFTKFSTSFSRDHEIWIRFIKIDILIFLKRSRWVITKAEKWQIIARG